MCPAGSLRSLAFNDQLLFSLAAPLSDQLLFEMEGAADLTSLPREFHPEFPDEVEREEQNAQTTIDLFHKWKGQEPAKYAKDQQDQ